VPTPLAASAGLGLDGVPGIGGAPLAVVNDQTGPVVDPEALRATICQKYVVLAVSAGGAYDAAACPLDTVGGGLPVPNATS
jgi:hypothetical protein